MNNQVIIVGAGGHARVVIDIFRQSDTWDPIGCLDMAVPVGSVIEGVPVIGTDEMLTTLRQEGACFAFAAVGDNALRFRLLQKLQQLGYRLPNAISPYAYIAPSARLGVGIAIMPGAIVGPEVVLGDGVVVNTHASVDHESVVESCGHVAPGATLSGKVHMEALAMVGCGASVIQQRRIGTGTIVGAGAVVVHDLPPHVVAHGVPARVRRSVACRQAA